MGESFQKLNLTNAYLFAAAMQDEEICRNVLEIALNKRISRVKAHVEQVLFLDSEFKSVRFDVYASDEEEVSYDVEMQNDDTKNLPKRCRYYQAELDVTSLRPGEDYQQLKPGYIIFICSFDPFGKGRCQYVFEEYCKEADIPLGDETQKIFFNTNGTDTENVTPELLHLFEYLKQSTEEVAVRHQDEKILKIHERVKYLKRDRKLEAGYMTMEEYIHQEAERRAKLMAESMAGIDGRVDGRVNGSIKSSTKHPCTAGRSWNTSGSNKKSACKGNRMKMCYLRGLSLQHARILLKSFSLKCRDRSVSFLIGNFNR